MSKVQLLEKEFNRLSNKISVPERIKPIFGPSDYDEKPYVFEEFTFSNYLIFGNSHCQVCKISFFMKRIALRVSPDLPPV